MTALEREPTDLEVIAAVAAWARPFLRGDAPVFGTPEWLALPLDDLRRSAAVVRAALGYWRVGAPVEDLEQRAEAALDKLASVGVCDQEHWAAEGRIPLRAELTRLRDWETRGLGREITQAEVRARWTGPGDELEATG